MNESTELTAYGLTRTRRAGRVAGPTRESRHRASVAAERRSARRHRLAETVRSIADRLDS